MQTALTIAAAIVAILTIRAYHAEPQQARWAYVFKPLATALLIAVAAVPLFAHPSSLLAISSPLLRYRLPILVGLSFSLAGDVLLMLPKDRFIPGLGSFLVAHVAYVVAFLGGLESGIPLLPFLCYGMLGGGLLVVLWTRLGSGLRIAVGVYVFAIVLMAGSAFARWDALRTLGALAAASGAFLFVVSDAVLAIDRFHTRVKAARAVILSTYYVAQTLIAWS